MTEPLRLPPGIHRIEAEAYHCDPHERPSLSSTLARLLLAQSPRHAWVSHPRLNPDWQPTIKKAFDLGRAAHRICLGCGDSFGIIPDELLSADGGIRSKEAREHVAAMREEGLTPLKAVEHDTILAMCEAITVQLEAYRGRDRTDIDPEHSELAVLAEIDGCPVRALIDNAPPGRDYLVDVKTTTDASPEACVRAIVRWGYDVQAAHYQDVWHAATGEQRTMRFVFVEKEPPFGVSVVELYASDDLGRDGDADWMLTARDKCREARRIWLECLDAGTWPGYPAQVAVVGAPVWHNARWAERETGRRVITPEAIALWRQAQAPEGFIP